MPTREVLETVMFGRRSISISFVFCQLEALQFLGFGSFGVWG